MANETATKFDKKYLERLASVYLDRYDQQGFVEARRWYDEFLTSELRTAVHPAIIAEVARRLGAKKE